MIITVRVLQGVGLFETVVKAQPGVQKIRKTTSLDVFEVFIDMDPIIFINNFNNKLSRICEIELISGK